MVMIQHKYSQHHVTENSTFSALDILETLIEFQPTLGKLYNTVGGLNTLVAKLLGAASQHLKQKLLKIINSLPNDGRRRFEIDLLRKLLKKGNCFKLGNCVRK